jgi:D-serine deaminase-like pyridoxal phosphate-dependent protein
VLESFYGRQGTISIMAALLPLPSKAELVQQFVGKSLHDIPLPAAVLDIAAVKRNCKKMLDAVEALGFDFLPLVNVHKVSSGFAWLL